MFRIVLCSYLCIIEQFQLQRRERDIRQMKPRIYRRHHLNRHWGGGGARMARGVSKQNSHSLMIANET